MLWCRSHLVWLVFEGSIPTCAGFHSENFFVTCYITNYIPAAQDPSLFCESRSGLRDYISPWYHFCIKAMFISKGGYVEGEPKSVNPESVKKAYRPVRACNLPGFMLRRIGTTIETCGNSGLPRRAIPFCHSAVLAFCRPAVLPFCHSVILSFCHSGIRINSNCYATDLLVFSL